MQREDTAESATQVLQNNRHMTNGTRGRPAHLSLSARDMAERETCLKRSRTAASLAPMYLFSSSGPLTPTKRRPAAATAAPTTCVLPQPGGPYSSTPVAALCLMGLSLTDSDACAKAPRNR